MMSKTIRIYCKEENVDTVKKAIGSYTDYNGFMVSIAINNSVRLIFNCNMFKVNKLKNDIKLLNNIGIEVEMR